MKGMGRLTSNGVQMTKDENEYNTIYGVVSPFEYKTEEEQKPKKNKNTPSGLGWLSLASETTPIKINENYCTMYIQ